MICSAGVGVPVCVDGVGSWGSSDKALIRDEVFIIAVPAVDGQMAFLVAHLTARPIVVEVALRALPIVVGGVLLLVTTAATKAATATVSSSTRRPAPSASATCRASTTPVGRVGGGERAIL